jgi:predicted metal-dependent hydrolase
MKETILISFIIIIIYIFLFLNRNNVVYIESNTGTKFLVHKDKDKIEKANLLGELVEKLYQLKYHLKKNISSFSEYKNYINLMDNNFKEDRTIIYETDPDSTLTSYSVNKGEEISFCLRSKKTGKLHDINLLTYVGIHELSHIGCPEIGHGELFKTVFKFFAQEAISLGIYKKVDYSELPVEYCGMILSSSII